MINDLTLRASAAFHVHVSHKFAHANNTQPPIVSATRSQVGIGFLVVLGHIGLLSSLKYSRETEVINPEN